jgi:hypothetical protein
MNDLSTAKNKGLGNNALGSKWQAMLPILIEEIIEAKRRSISKHENMHYVWVLDWWQQWLR